MAITFEGFATHSGNPTTSATVTIPATVNDGDILIVSVSNGGGTGLGTCVDNSGVGSWTNKVNQSGITMAGNVWWKRVTNQAVERSATITKAGQTDSTAAGLAIYRGCIASGDPFDGTPVSESNASADNSQAGITTLTAGAMVCLDVAVTEDTRNPGSQSTTSPGALAERYDANSSGGTDAEVAHASAIKASAGVTGNFTWTMDANHNTVSIGYALTQEDVVETHNAAALSAGTSTVSAASTVTRPAASVIAASSSVGATGFVHGAGFPVVAATNNTGGAALDTTTAHTVNMPSGVASGDLLIAFGSWDGGPTISGWPAGWTSLFDETTTTLLRVLCRYKIADGTETSFDLTSSASESSSIITARITEWHGTTPPEVGTTSSSTSINPDPPSLNPAGWNVENTLWIALEGWDDGSTNCTSAPTNYANLVICRKNTASNGCGHAIAFRELAATSADPGTFTNTVSEIWRANTLAIRPSAGGITHNAAAQIAGTSSVSGAAKVTRKVAATSAGATTVSAAAEIIHIVAASAQVSSTSTASGAAKVSRRVATLSASASTVSASATTEGPVRVASQIASASTLVATASLREGLEAAAQIAGASGVSGFAHVIGRLDSSASISASSALTATLFVPYAAGSLGTDAAAYGKFLTDASGIPRFGSTSQILLRYQLDSEVTTTQYYGTEVVAIATRGTDVEMEVQRLAALTP